MNTQSQAHILIVDDEPINVVILSSIFEGYYISTASSGEEALEMIASSKPDLILLDVVMQGIDGYEVCSRLKENPETRNIPIIFLTGKNDEVSEIIGYELGAIDYITKPINPKIVQARVKSLIELRQIHAHLSGIDTPD